MNHINVRVLRDLRNRKLTADYEVLRQSFKYIARNETQPTRTRYQAQLALNAVARPARPTNIKNRCVETGRGKGILSEFRMCRFQFRLKALQGDIPGVIKAQW